MAKKLDLNKLKDEIDNRKQSRNTVPSTLGESVGVGIAPRDEFLHGLVSSLHTGKSTPSTNLIKVVENKIAEKKGETRKMSVSVNENQSLTPIISTSHNEVMSPDREEQMYRDIENRKKQTLAESIEAFSGNKSQKPQSSMINFGGQQYLTSLPKEYVQSNIPVGTSMQLNEAVLTESVKNVVNNYLSENLSAVFEEAIKGTIIEMYAVERIKEVLNENRDLIKSVVVETIRDIQTRNKAKAQS